ncbi:hypothetical protein [Celeribacter neptunius]|uniref:Uncharacterized protein n=1 Tax=Celeribacter neptunius TaxID=588602 RepID=A0A1I3Y2R1_9RHOB|nr:hypothetical protein [Celeribacter neptunius]SFK26043.1 hypothetical protein SAMN04487991_4236 [Celeribacter neptunius]
MSPYVASLCYIFLVLLLGAISTWAFDGQLWPLLLAAIAIFSLSFRLSKTARFQKSAVDKVYYSFALLGAVLFFHVRHGDRIEYELYADLNRQIVSTTRMQESVRTLEGTLERFGDLQILVSDHPQSVVNAIGQAYAEFSASAVIKMTLIESEACLESSGFKLEMPDANISGQDKSPDLTDALLEQNRRELASYACETAIARLASERKAYLATFQKPETPEELLPLLANTTFANETISLSGQNALVSTLTKMVNQAFALDDLRQDLSNARDKLNELAKSVTTMREHIKTVMDEEKRKAATIWGRLALFIWPWMILSLLGLKLSRQD